MPDWLKRRIPLPLPQVALGLLIAAFLLPGLVGHDPWKTEDAVGFGVVWQLLDGGSWLTPQLAGESWFDDGPLYFWFAAIFARGLAFVLPPHDGARFASAFFIFGALWFVRLASRTLYGKPAGDLSLLALMGCVGLMWHAHETAAESAMLAGLAAAYYGLAIANQKPVKGGVFFGAGAGVAFLAKGITALMQPVAASLLVLPLCDALRVRNYAKAVGIGGAMLAPFVVIWPAAVAIQAPAFFEGWWAWQLRTITQVPSWNSFVDLLKMLAWAAWPAWPLTLWAAWAYRRQLGNPGFAVPVVATFVSLVLLLASGTQREMDALALLVPLSIPAGSAALALRRGAANALTSFSIMTFGLLAGAVWVMWFAMMTGVPAPLARNVAKLEPGFEPHFAWLPFVVAMTLTAGWIVLNFRCERSTLRSLPLWASGVALVWGLATTIWLAWIDYGKTYGPVAAALAKQLPANVRCVESRGLGETQRAVFHYHAGLVTRRAEVHGRTDCPYLLVQSSSGEAAADPGKGWRRVWEGNRPRDRERYRLYRRV
jgi:4-amino-4-deoxy-L-arabinose transferase-like glycosyltransferase